MSGYRPDVEALVEPGVTEGRVGGGTLQLVTVRLFSAPGDHEQPPPEDAFTHLRPGEARQLAFALLEAAEHAERITDRQAS